MAKQLNEETPMFQDFTYSTLFGNIFPTAIEAKAARDAAYREAKAAGKIVRRSVLKGQLRQYASFGVPDGRVCDCYKLHVSY